MVCPSRPSLLYRLWSKMVTAFGHSMLLWSPPKVKGCHIEQFLTTAKSGDIVLRTMNRSLSRFIPGRFVHSGVAIGDGQLIHATAKGTYQESLIGFAQIQDHIGIFRPNYLYEKNAEMAVEQAKQYLGTPYDFLFDNGTRRLYCHELSWLCLAAGGIIVLPKGTFITADTLLAADGKLIFEAPNP